MNVNWQNLKSAIQKGKAAYDGVGFGSTPDTCNVGFYDHPMSDLNEAADEYAIDNPNIFTFGTSQWGKTDKIKE